MSAVLRDRRQFIGGSDAAAILGVSTWTTAVGLWLEKTGREPPKKANPERERRLARGRKLEPFIVDMLLDRLAEDGHEVEVLAANEVFVDREHKFLQAEIDRVLRVDGELVNAEIKSASGFMRAKWGTENTDEVPLEYAAQAAHQMMVTKRSRTLFGALVGLDDVRIYWQDRDEETIAGLRQQEVRFWKEAVQADKPPDPRTFQDLRSLYPVDNDRTGEVSEDLAELVRELRRTRDEKRRLDGRDEELSFEIGRVMGPLARLTHGGELLCTWGVEKRTQFLLDSFRRAHRGLAELFTERSEQRVLRLKVKG